MIHSRRQPKDHTLGNKRALYEEGLWIPVLVRYPRLFPEGEVNDDPVLNIDLAATYLNLAGLPAQAHLPRRLHGRCQADRGSQAPGMAGGV